MSKKTTSALITVLVIAVIGVGVWYVSARNKDADDKMTAETSSHSEHSMKKDDDKMANENIQTITLGAVGGYTASGSATRTMTGEYVHTISANIPQPAEGKFYEGWLVVDANDFITTGKLVAGEGNTWTLKYTSDKDLSKYVKVVVTEETSANGQDNVPEAHVLEGSF